MENTGKPGVDLLADELQPYFRFTPASKGERFANFLIDNLVMRFALTYLTGLAVAQIGGAIAPGFMYRIVYEKQTWSLLLFSYIIGIVNYLLYYTLCEKLFNGQTLGKLITKTRAITTDGEDLTFKDALLRTLTRLVPFEAFSALGDAPWHDTWTKTTVVKQHNSN